MSICSLDSLVLLMKHLVKHFMDMKACKVSGNRFDVNIE